MPSITEDHVLRELDSRRSSSLEQICRRLGVERSSERRYSSGYSKADWKKYEEIGRILQRLKKSNQADYLSKANGGPGWIRK